MSFMPTHCPFKLHVWTFNSMPVTCIVARILLLNDEEVEEAELGGFTDSEQTFFAGNVVHDQLVQVTMTTIRMIDADGINLIWYVMCCVLIG